MSGPLVESKLFAPAARSGIVTRPRITDRLPRVGGRLVLVSAPAGFGKTTLLADWLAGSDPDRELATAWVSLDEGDRSASSFWTYVFTALDRAVPGVGDGALQQVRGGHEPTHAVLAGMLNELSVLPGELTLVLDDYHLAEGPDVRPGMTFLVDHLPPQLCLVISTRADPALPLARLRVRGELSEVRAADLRFTTEETDAYLNDTGGLDLGAGDIAALEARTEGWVAALQLAALSLRGRTDPSAFVAGFAGDDRFVVDYLLEEVLDRQPGPVRRFLLETSVLDRLTGPLCDAVTGGSDGNGMLERLDRANLFLVPLDDQRRWYRYHHLFADLLRSRLVDDDEGAVGVAELHRRASAWYDETGHAVAAVRHALAAGDVDRAAELVELAVPGLRRDREEATLRRWIQELPDAVVQRRPVLAAGFIGALMSTNEFAEAERRLADLERLLGPPGEEPQGLAERSGLVVVDTAELARVPGCLELWRAGLALVGGDLTGTEHHARRAVELAPVSDDLTRASAAALAGLASWTTGDLEAAHRGYTDAAAGLGRLGYVADVLGCSTTLADLETTQGKLRQAQHTCEQALRLAAGNPSLRGTRDMHTCLAELAVQRNDLTTAGEHLRRAEELGEQAGMPRNPYRWRAAMALLRDAEGDREAALGLLAEAERVYVGDFAPDVRPVPAMRARLLAAHGDLPAARAWARERGLAPGDRLSYLREYEYVTLARILLAEHISDGTAQAPEDVIGLLERLLAAAETGARDGTVIEVLTLLARAHHAAHDETSALAALERALDLAEPEGFARVFLDGGASMTQLLSTLNRRRPGRPYLRQLIDAARPMFQPSEAETAARVGSASADELVDPLTRRERDVLRMLASELDGPSIARELVLSLNTVRTHTRNLYAKLGVTNRRAAVNRAHQLNLLSRTSAD